MKKLILMFFVILTVAFAAKITVVDFGNLREEPNVKSEKIDIVSSGTYEVIDTYSDYTYVKVISNSINVGKEGYIYTPLLNEKLSENIFSTKDACINKEEKKGTKLCTVKEGAIVKVIKINVTWYKIKFEELEGWISKISVK